MKKHKSNKNGFQVEKFHLSIFPIEILIRKYNYATNILQIPLHIHCSFVILRSKKKWTKKIQNNNLYIKINEKQLNNVLTPKMSKHLTTYKNKSLKRPKQTRIATYYSYKVHE